MKLYKCYNTEITGTLETDIYVPICIRFESNNLKPRELFIYRFINKKSSLIELTINSKTNKLIEFTFVSINEATSGLLSNVFSRTDENGNPDFDTSMFNNNSIVTYSVDFDTVVSNGCVEILFANEKEVAKVIFMNFICIITNINDEIIGFRLHGFSEEQWVELKTAIHHSSGKSL